MTTAGPVHAVAWALQRPDGRTFGTAADADGARDLLDDLHAHLTTSQGGRP